MIFVDANIPIYASGTPHPLRPPCERIVRAMARNREVFVTDIEVLQELLHVALRPRPNAARRAAFSAFVELTAGRVLGVDTVDVTSAADLSDAVPGVSTRDLVHAAVMGRHGIRRVVSADTDFDRVPDIERLDPALLAEWEDPAWFS